MKGFFEVVSPAEFRGLLQSFAPLEPEEIGIGQALGRVLARDVVSDVDVPATDRSCMDGFALAARDSFGASEANPAYLEIAGEVEIAGQADFRLGPGECAKVVTGSSLPPGADAVIMLEYAHELEGGGVEFMRACAPGEHVMPQGEDARAGQAALEAGRLLRVPEIGLLAAVGASKVWTHRRPKAAIISTGDELIEIERNPKPGQIRDVNTHTLAAMVSQAGAAPLPLGLVGDDQAKLEAALAQAIDAADVVFISGGSSVGMRDFTVAALAALGDCEILAHGVAVSPGKPTILARCRGKAVFGLPGQISSAQVIMLIFGLPFLRHLAGDSLAFDRPVPSLSAKLARNAASAQGREDYLRVRLERTEAGYLAHPVLGKSGLLRSLLEADGLLRIEAASEGLAAGSLVEVRLLPV